MATDDTRTGVERIAAERARQMGAWGYSEDHDDALDGGELAWAAACYAAPERIFVPRDRAAGRTYADPWPSEWSDHRKRPKRSNYPTPELVTGTERIRVLEKAGALIAAEIDRLLRLHALFGAPDAR